MLLSNIISRKVTINGKYSAAWSQIDHDKCNDLSSARGKVGDHMRKNEICCVGARELQ
jgi:hypothetical protein